MSLSLLNMHPFCEALLSFLVSKWLFFQLIKFNVTVNTGIYWYVNNLSFHAERFKKTDLDKDTLRKERGGKIKISMT